jgi:DNA invertase Pin-like site-specific DNA recombinase
MVILLHNLNPFDVSPVSISNMPPAQMEVFRMKAKCAAVYARVSTGEQNTEVQERSLREYVNRRGWQLHKIYRDKGFSGAKSSRPALDELMKDCRRRSIDVVVVWKFDRFARSLKTLISALENFRALGIDFVSVTEAVDTSLPAGEMLFQMIGAVAQFERSLIAERVKAGLDHARKNGVVLGRPALRKLTKKEIAQLRRRRMNGKQPYRTLATEFGISVWTAHALCRKSQKN